MPTHWTSRFVTIVFCTFLFSITSLAFFQADSVSLIPRSSAFDLSSFTGPNISDDAIAADAAGDYRSAASGNWNSTASWETFDGTNWIPATATPTSANAGVITVRSGHTITITATVTYDQLVVNSGGQVTVPPGVSTTLADGPGTDAVINGTWLNTSSGWTMGSGATWSLGAGATFIHNATTAIAAPLGAGTLDPNSNFIYRGSSTLTPSVSVSGRTYGNLSFESTSGTYTVNASGGSALLINGNLTIGTGTTLNIGMTGSFNIKGNITANSVSTLNFNPSGTPFLTLSGTASQTIGGAGNITFNGNQWIDVTNPAGVNIQKNLDLAGGVFNVSGTGRVNFGTNAIIGGGSTFSSAAGTTIGIGSPDGINTGSALGNIRITGTRTYTAGTTFVYNGTANQVTGNGLPSSVANLTIANTGTAGNNTVTGSATQTVTNLLRIQQGNYVGAGVDKDVQIDSTGVLSASGTTNVNGNWSNSGTFTPNSNAVVLNGGNQTISGQTSFFNLSKSTASATTLTFEAGKTQTITNSLTLAGASGNLVSLRSSSPGTRWGLSAPATQIVNFVDAQDSDASGGSLISQTNSTNSGNNLNWNFPPPPNPGTIQLSSSTYSGSENGGSITATLKRIGGSSGSVGVSASVGGSGGTANGGSVCSANIDFISTFGSITWADGDTADKSVNITLCNDAVYEGDETFLVDLVGPTGGATLGAPSSATVTIVDDETPPSATVDLSSATYKVSEGTSQLAVTLIRGGTSTNSFTVDVNTSDGSALAGTCGQPGADYQAVSTTVSFAAGDSTKVVNVPICTDMLDESPAETLNITLSNASSGAAVGVVNQATISIIDAATEFTNYTDHLNAAPNQTVSSSVTVTGYQGNVSGLRVTLNGLSANIADDLDVLLVDPAGRKYALVGDVGGGGNLNNVTLTFEDTGSAGFVPDSGPIAEGQNYMPTNCESPVTDFAGSPTGPIVEPGCGPTLTNTMATTFGNQNPNGAWTLYVRNDGGNAFGTVSSVSLTGWGIQFIETTAAAVSVSGRVVTVAGDGVRGASVTIAGGDLTYPISVRTSASGEYRFDGLQPGTTYIVSVKAKYYRVTNPARPVLVLDDVANVDFVAEQR